MDETILWACSIINAVAVTAVFLRDEEDKNGIKLDWFMNIVIIVFMFIMSAIGTFLLILMFIETNADEIRHRWGKVYNKTKRFIFRRSTEEKF